MARRVPRSKAGKRRKAKTVMGEFKRGQLHSGRSGRVVKKRAQAVAIMLRMTGQSRKRRRKR